MMPIIFLIALQIVIAGIVIFVLKRLLDRELEQAAIEKAMALKNNVEIKIVHVYSAKELSLQVQKQIESILKDKFANGQVVFERLSHLKGGVMIKVGEEVLDFSLSSRLENFWS